MTPVTKSMVGDDGKVQVYDLGLRKMRRVAAVDAREMLNHPLGPTATLEEPEVELVGPGGRRVVRHSEVPLWTSKGYKELEPSDPTTSSSESGTSSNETSTGGGEGSSAGSQDKPSAEPYDWEQHGVDKLRQFGVEAGIGNATHMKRAELIPLLQKSGWRPPQK